MKPYIRGKSFHLAGGYIGQICRYYVKLFVYRRDKVSLNKSHTLGNTVAYSVSICHLKCLYGNIGGQYFHTGEFFRQRNGNGTTAGPHIDDRSGPPVPFTDDIYCLLYQKFGLRPRDQGIRGNIELQPVELLMACDICHRLVAATAHNQPFIRAGIYFRYSRVQLNQQLRFPKPENMTEQQSRFQSSLFNAGRFQSLSAFVKSLLYRLNRLSFQIRGSSHDRQLNPA
ncbi:MAG: hypothetical protein R6U89_09705 [Dehalococcoidia bacterium]